MNKHIIYIESLPTLFLQILGVTMEQNPEFEVVMKSLIRGWRVSKNKRFLIVVENLYLLLFTVRLFRIR